MNKKYERKKQHKLMLPKESYPTIFEVSIPATQTVVLTRTQWVTKESIQSLAWWLLYRQHLKYNMHVIKSKLFGLQREAEISVGVINKQGWWKKEKMEPNILLSWRPVALG